MSMHAAAIAGTLRFYIDAIAETRTEPVIEVEGVAYFDADTPLGRFRFTVVELPERLPLRLVAPPFDWAQE